MQATKSGRLPTQAAAALPFQSSSTGSESVGYKIATYLLLSHAAPLQRLLAHRDNSGRNILLDSAVSQNLDLLQFLLDQGADPTDADSLGRNMIHHAAMMGHLNVLKLLAQISVISDYWNVKDAWDDWTPLMHAARQGYIDIVQYLVETIHVDLACVDKQGRTAKDIGTDQQFLLDIVLLISYIATLWHHESIISLL
jgi:ankyrin repeat protein